FARQQRVPARSMLVRSGHMACTLVMQGAGIAFVDNLTAAAWPTAGLEYRPMARSPQFKVYAVWNQNRPPSVLGRRLFSQVATSLKTR
nr:hypothetical protein [Burkholderiaceae bacterium]